MTRQREKDCYSCIYRGIWLGGGDAHMACNNANVCRMNITPVNCQPCEYYESDEESEGDEG